MFLVSVCHSGAKDVTSAKAFGPEAESQESWDPFSQMRLII